MRQLWTRYKEWYKPRQFMVTVATDLLVLILIGLTAGLIELAQPFERFVIANLFVYFGWSGFNHVFSCFASPVCDGVAFCLACAATVLVTQIIKVTSGKLRPDFLDRCKPQLPLPPSTSDLICTGDPTVVKDGRKSFPSGHASLAFAGLSFLSFYYAGAVKLYANGKSRSFHGFLTLIPICGAILIAISRTTDNKHTDRDVFFGGLIGLIFGYGVYRFYYPKLNSRNCKVPYRILVLEKQSCLPVHTNDQELVFRRNDGECCGVESPEGTRGEGLVGCVHGVGGESGETRVDVGFGAGGSGK
ncbi:phosphatidic acid phosphatase type 2/haloperoxidase [Paraphysoderma sedebokerense]|nr:phosphatidic acid phosphatase type 2/haloperoxidase [Paraphysoderma sedebokerense]